MWAKRYVLNQRAATHVRERRGMVIAVGGSKSVKMFDSVRMTMQYFFDAVEAQPFSSLFANNIDEKGNVAARADIMREAFRLGQDLVAGPSRSAKQAATTSFIERR